jgi:hypothetical protein
VEGDTIFTRAATGTLAVVAINGWNRFASGFGVSPALGKARG